MILRFNDHEGDPVAVESAAIVAVSVGALNGPQRLPVDRLTGELRVTLIWCAGLGQPLMVAEPFALVVRAWERSREIARAVEQVATLNGDLAGWRYPAVVKESRG